MLPPDVPPPMNMPFFFASLKVAISYAFVGAVLSETVASNRGIGNVMSHTAFGDAVGGLNGCAAVLTALIHAKLAGKGQFVDLAQIECMNIKFVNAPIAEASAAFFGAEKRGNGILAA